MNERQFGSVTRFSQSTLVVNSVIRNTFILLGLSCLFSALMAGTAIVTNAPYLGPVITMLGYFGLLFLVNKLKNSGAGIVAVFALTGFLGYTIGPFLNAIMSSYTNGLSIVMTALGGTGLIFFALSAYAMTTRKDFSYLGGFLTVGMMALLIASLVGIFFSVPVLNLVISFFVIVLMSGFVLFELSNVINGGERNYIVATVSIFASLFNIFINLVQLLAAFSGRND